MKIDFLGGAYRGRSPNASPQECINFFYEKGEDEDTLVSTPGATVFDSSYSGEVRGGIGFNSRAFFVIGNKLVSYDAQGTSIDHGNLNSSSGRVGMAHNGTRPGANQQIMIVDGTEEYIFDNLTNTVTSVGTKGSESVIFMDGYFFYSEKGTDRIWNTNLYNGVVTDATDFITAEGDPDPILGLATDQRQLIAGGGITTSMFYNAGTIDNVLSRFQGGYTQTGLAAPHALARFDNTVMWLTKNERGEGMVVRPGEGINPSIVSTPAVNYQISQYSRIDDAFAYVYQDEGHEFFVLTFPTAGVTWAYDASTQEWHKRQHPINGKLDRERYNCHVFAFGKHLLGDFENGKIYEFDSSIGTFDGVRVPRIRISPEVSSKERRERISTVQLDIEEGLGDPNEEDSLFWLSYSKNGGHTFSNERRQSGGNLGQYAKRLLWRRLGHARNWIFKIRTWSPNRIIIKGLIAREYGEQL